MKQDTLARKLRVLRAERGLTLREAEELTGVDKDTLSKLERGIRHAQDVTLSRIARGYEIPFEELIEEPALAGKAEAPREAGPERPEQQPHTRERDEVDVWTGHILRRAEKIRKAASDETNPVFTNPQRAFDFASHCWEEGQDLYLTVVEEVPSVLLDEPFNAEPWDDLTEAVKAFISAVERVEERAQALKTIAPEDSLARKRAERGREVFESLRKSRRVG